MLRLILGDQLNAAHSWFQKTESNVHYLMMEILPESQYVTHHIQKIIGFFLAMRAFAAHLRSEGHAVIYLSLDHPENLQSFEENIRSLIQKHPYTQFEYQLPDEYRLDVLLAGLCQGLSIPTLAVDTEHFLSTREDLSRFFKSKKTYLMESFYREMRKKYHILMEGKKPLQGKWNFDRENRKKYKPGVPIPKPLLFNHQALEIFQMIQKYHVAYLGEVDPEAFSWPVTRSEALRLLDYFTEHCLENFGLYQDAMETSEPFLYHSRLSFALNIKLLNPLEVIRKTVAHWEQNQDRISIAQIEGFVRQILGWREYMRGVYWAHMPAYAQSNYFNHQNQLPGFFWNADTRMFCLKQAIGQSLKYAYAHHIQRLMVTGNFALLAGVHPDYVDQWYLGIYIDAIEWVEITNTRGMSQFADGGLVGTKPYVSSANYIDKMSSYCGACVYDHKKKYGENACPFNSLYWNFYHKHREKLSKNPRLSIVYKVWENMQPEERAKILHQAHTYLNKIEEL